MSARYRFLPWLREKAATAVRTVETLAPDLPARPALPVGLRVNGRENLSVALGLYGPGDVTGFDSRMIVRTDPGNRASGFEPNYFPSIEFDIPSLPWMLTPATGDARGRLRPWLVLIVVRRQPGVTLTFDRTRPLPVLRIGEPARPAAELPDLADSWAWAHTQLLDAEGGSPRSLLADADGRPLSRLICTRRLEPRAVYLACLVPAFETGRRSGLDQITPPGEDPKLAPAWRLADDPPVIELPVYYHWEFGTGVGGDFEALARKLKGRPVPEGVGSRSLRVDDAAFALPDAGTLTLEGALRPPTQRPDQPVSATFQDALRELLNRPDALRLGASDPEPVVAPPIYGAWQAARVRIDERAPLWLRAVNLDPRHRSAAGLGTLVVQDQQENLMASAWAQLGAGTREKDKLRQQELARTVMRTVHRAIATLSPERFLRVTAPLHARVRLALPADLPAGAPLPDGAAAPRTVREQIRTSDVPVALTSASFRRVTRPLGPVVRRATEAARTAALAGGSPTAPTSGAVSGVSGAAVTGGVSGATISVRDTVAIRDTVVVRDTLAPSTTAVPGGAVSTAGTPTPESPLSPRTLSFATRFGTLPELSLTFTSAAAVSSSVDAAAIEQRLQSLIVPSTMIEEAGRFNASVRQVAGYLAQVVGGGTPPKRPTLPLERLRGVLLERLDPGVTLPPSTGGVQTGGPAETGAPEQPADAPLPTPSLPGPSFPQPMYESLRDLAPDLLLPGLDRIPTDSATLLETNPRFVEAFMLGLNHEMSRELLWREYPSDLRATSFRRFWGGSLVMPEIHEWAPEDALGTHVESVEGGEQLVLLIRGELLDRYPRTVIYAVRAVDRRTPGSERRPPIFRAALAGDSTCLGFDLTAEEVQGEDGGAGWFFVLEQPPGQPRFGLDESTTTGRDPAGLPSWNDLAWGDVAANDEAFARLTHVPLAGPLERHRIGALEWGLNGGHMAAITLQRPVRVLLHASDLLRVEN